MKKSIAVLITLENENKKWYLVTIPYQGEKGNYLITSMKRNLKKYYPTTWNLKEHIEKGN